MRPKLLDLFCGQGGCSRGYTDAGFDVTGVDINPQPHYPYQFVQVDWASYLAAHWQEYDVLHASPPCQAWSIETPDACKANHPKLITAVRSALEQTGKPFVIENVPGARHELQNPIMLCGSMFGLQVWRHRYFEINPEIFSLLPSCDHSFVPVLVTGTPRRKGYPRKDPPAQTRRDAMGIDWPMTILGLDEAIPPAYTRSIGWQMLNALGVLR
jgi:DNA (cytosine-5)-methyltransferase 1